MIAVWHSLEEKELGHSNVEDTVVCLGEGHQQTGEL